MAVLLALLSGCAGPQAEDASDALSKADSFRYDIQVDVRVRAGIGAGASASYRGTGTSLPQQRRLDLSFPAPGTGPQHLISDGDTQFVQTNGEWTRVQRPSFGRSLTTTSQNSTFDGALFDPASYLPHAESDQKLFLADGDKFVYTCSLDSSVNASCQNLGLSLGAIQDRSTIGQADLTIALDGDGRPIDIRAKIVFGNGSTFGGTLTMTANLHDYGDPISIEPPALP